MQKKVLQDINTRNSDIKKEESFNRKWDYSQGGAGIVERGDSDSDSDSDLDQELETDSMNKTSNTRHKKNNWGGGGRKGFLGLPRLVWIGVVVLIIIILSFVFWSMSATATVKVILSQQTTVINDNFDVKREKNTEGVLVYEIIKLQEKATRDVQPTKEEEVEQKSSGQIVVYNKHSESTERLITNTRFEAPDGKIYRINKAITIPGAKGSGDDMIPGSLEVTVYADEVGEEYNKGLVDFTIPGLKDTSLEGDIFARSKTEMTGGYNGILKSASEEDIKNTSEALQQELRNSLLAGIRSKIGDNVLYEEAIFIDFTTHTPTELSENGMLTIEETGLLQAIVFDKKELSSEIAKKSLSSYDGNIVLVSNLDEMSFVFVNKEEFDPAINETFNFILSGTPHIVWEIDEVALKNDLAGLSKSSMSTVIQNSYPSVRRIEAEIKPFWKGSFPDNPNVIVVEEVLE